MKTNATTYGTSNFVNFSAACRYYAAYGFNADDVRAKIKAGEIATGRPATWHGETATVNKEGRWVITSPEPACI